MRNPAGSISQLPVRRDPLGPPSACPVPSEPSEGEISPKTRRLSVAYVAHVSDGSFDRGDQNRGQTRQDRAADAGESARLSHEHLEGEVLILQMGKQSVWRLAGSGIALVIAACIVGARSPVILGIIAAIYLAVAWAQGVGYRVRVGIGGVTALTLWGKSRRLHWSDVRSVSFPRGEIVLHGKGGGRVRVPATFDGHRATIRLLRIRLPRAALNQSRIGLETHYLCQWDDCEW